MQLAARATAASEGSRRLGSLFLLWAVARLAYHLLFAAGFLSPSLPLAAVGGDGGGAEHDAAQARLVEAIREATAVAGGAAGEAQTSPPFDRLVFVVIDALRHDFVYGERFSGGLSWLRSAVRGEAEAGDDDGTDGALPGVRSYVALAKSPTVTLPRLKALTGGSAPQFTDLVLNLGSGSARRGHGGARAAAAPETWVEALHGAGKRVLFFGDDTWLRLFPGLLAVESEGVHSFFVADSIEVDRNVTRHLPRAFSPRDGGAPGYALSWDALILHYLGVDHIGHGGGGPYSARMMEKLQEMDGVVGEIYGHIREDPRALLVVLGDHGMTDGGNHGGASLDEVQTACVLASSGYARVPPGGGETVGPRDGTIDQVDIAPTLAVLLGLEVPAQSTGQLVLSAVPPAVPPRQVLLMQLQVAIQLVSTAGRRPSSDGELNRRLDQALAMHLAHLQGSAPFGAVSALYKEVRCMQPFPVALPCGTFLRRSPAARLGSQWALANSARLGN